MTSTQHMPRRGPKPVRGAAQLPAARRRVLQAIADLGGRDVTITQLADHLDQHPNAARQHLDLLARDGLISVGDVRTTGPGRRPRGYTLTPRADVALGRTPDEAHDLAGVFASYLVATGAGRNEAQEIGRMWGSNRAGQLAREDSDHIDAVVEVLDILGFEPERATTSEGEALILRTCPLLDLAHENPEFICQIHQGLIDGVLRRLGASEGVELLPFSDPDGCRARLGSTHPSGGERGVAV